MFYLMTGTGGRGTYESGWVLPIRMASNIISAIYRTKLINRIQTFSLSESTCMNSLLSPYHLNNGIIKHGTGR